MIWRDDKMRGKSMNRFFRILLASLIVTMLIGSILTVSAFAADPIIVTVPEYTVDVPPAEIEPQYQARLFNGAARGVSDWQTTVADGKITLQRYVGSETHVVVPAEINGYPVVSLNQTFWGNTSIVSVELSSSVTEIGRGAFYGCTALESVTGGSIASLGEYAFYSCTSLTEVPQLAAGIEIPSAAFYECNALTAVESGSIASLGEHCFRGCWLLTQVPALATGMTEIPAYAFLQCKSLESVSIPSTVTTIGEGAFRECEALELISVPPNVTSIGICGFYGCTSLTTVVLNNGLLTIGEHAFNWSKAIAELDIPDTVVSIGDYAFAHATTLIVGDKTYAQTWAAANGYMSRVRGSEDLSDEIAPNETDAGKKADAIVAALVTDDMNDYQKALILHDYLILHASYDTSLKRYEPEDILIHHSGVCQAYTEAYEMLLQRAGIECAREYGDDHIWNMAKLDGDWVHIDCTWDDPVVQGGGSAENHNYFGITNYALEGIDSHECFEKPYIATSVIHSYAYQTGVLPGHMDALEAEVGAQIEQGELHGSAAEAFVSGSDNSSRILSRMIYQATPMNGLTWHSYPASVTTTFDWVNTIMSFDAYVNVPVTETMMLPEGLAALGDESLMGTTAHRFVLPDGKIEFGSDVFPNTYFVIEAPEGSDALSFAEEANIPWQISPAVVD